MVTPIRRTAVAVPRFTWDRGMTAIAVVFVLCLPLFFPRVYAVDSVEYYSYLPSLIFDHDLDFTDEYLRLDALNPNAGIKTGLLNRADPLTHRPINVAPIGSAILWLPAFLLAHGGVVLARAFGANIAADGFSRPYIWAVCLATALYGLGGLLLCYRLARRYTGVWAATIAVITCWLASPVVFFMYISPPWSHVPALFVTALFIVIWLETYGRRTIAGWVALGLLGGLMTLCREQLGLFMLLPALEGVTRYWSLLRGRRWPEMRALFTRHALFLAVVALSLVPQFLVYHALNGRWGPSKNVSAKLVWWSPHFFDTLIDPAHGALLWTPIWLLGIVGFVLLWGRDRRLMLLAGIALLAQVYINGSFDPTWHLSGSFGFRRLIEATPIFVLGVALLIDRWRLPHWTSAGACALMIAWNFGLIAQWSLPPRPIREGLVWSGMLDRQIQVAQLVVDRGGLLLFERCKLVENGRCR